MDGINENSMFLLPVDENEILKIVNDCKSKSSEDSDNLSMRFVKYIFNHISKSFTYICNLSFKSGIFPDRIKIAKVIPLHKSGEKPSFNNYRPVSLLSQFSKVLGKLFDSRLQAFIDKNNLLSSSQYGFRSNLSTSCTYGTNRRIK